MSNLHAEMFIYKFLVDNNSNVNMAGASTTATATFAFNVPAGRIASLERVNFRITDGTIRPTKFGGENALTNGLIVRVVDSAGSEILDFYDGQTIKRNVDFASISGIDVELDSVASDDMFTVRWTIEKAGAGLLLTSGQSFQIIRRDNLVGVTDFFAMVQGLFVEET